MTLALLLEPVADDMRRVDDVIRGRLASEVPLIQTISQYIIAAGGKRMRPALVLLIARALDCSKPAVHELAAVVEFIHTATLLHDDVVDESTLRRGRKTANAQFGNAASVLVGDFLYSRAFQMMVQSGGPQVLALLADATNLIAEGEVLQLLNMHNPGTDEAAYLRVIRFKTAKLFEAAAKVGAILAGASPLVQEQAAEYGQALGTAFQLIDDVLDYTGDAAELGKNIGDDLREGKPTLPVILALQRAQGEDRSFLESAIQDGVPQDDQAAIDRVVALINSTDSLSPARAHAQVEAQRAQAAIASWPENSAKTALLNLSQFAANRAL